MTHNIKTMLDEYTSLAPKKMLMESIEIPTSVCPEDIVDIIPSIEMRSDGPAILSLFLITKNFLCEVRLGAKDQEFDFVRKNSIKNYRFIFTEHIVKKEGKRNVKYKVAKVRLLHDITSDFVSEICYVGSKRKTWLKKVTKAIPINSIM